MQLLSLAGFETSPAACGPKETPHGNINLYDRSKKEDTS